MSAGSPSSLAEFNEGPPDRAAEALRPCNAAPRFAAELVAGRPYPDADALVSRAEEVARSLPWDEVSVALAAHPRIGDRVEGTSSEAQASRREQSSVAGADDATRAALLDGNREYEARFGHVYLVCASGRTGAELLAVLRSRLANEAAYERTVARRELGKINALRLARLAEESG